MRSPRSTVIAAARSVRDPGLIEIEARDIRRATEGVEYLLAGGFPGGAVTEISDDLLASSPLHGYRGCVRDDVDAFFSEIPRQRIADVVVALSQQMIAADEHRHFRAHAREELAQLARRIAAAQHDDRVGNPFEFQHRVAIDVAGFCKTRQHARRDDAARCDDELRRLQQHPVAYRETLRREKARRTKIKRKLFDPVDPVIGESLHELALSSRNVGHVHREPLRADS